MTYALISPNEPVYDYEGNEIGVRVAQVKSYTFEVAPPLFWAECADYVVADQYCYENGNIILIPIPPEPPVPEPVEQKGPTVVE